jgi:hypothetical protein
MLGLLSLFGLILSVLLRLASPASTATASSSSAHAESSNPAKTQHDDARRTPATSRHPAMRVAQAHERSKETCIEQ